MGDAHDAIAAEQELGVTLPVALEGGAGVVVGVPVELDYEPPVGPDDVDLVALDDDVRLRAWQPGFVAEVEEPPLELRAGDRRRAAVVTEHCPKPSEAAMPLAAADQPLDGPQVEQPAALGLVERPPQLPLRQDLSKIQESAGNRRDGNALSHYPVL
jgi:hypothetical protein